MVNEVLTSRSTTQRHHLLIPCFERRGSQRPSSLLPIRHSLPLLSHVDLFVYIAHVDNVYIVDNCD